MTIRASRTQLAAVLCVVCVSTGARAGGLYFSERGVRPLARGGAFVAGADDINAMWFNPAGLVDAQGTLLADAAFMLFSADFTRRTQVVGDGGAIQTFDFPTVHGDTPPVGIPTLGIAFPIGAEKRLTVGAGVFAPYAPLLRWPETLQDGTASPSRYSLVSLEGSLLAVLDLFAAYKISDEWRVGAGVEILNGVFQNVVDLDANPGLVGAPQDPQYDSLSRTRATIFTPSANAGITWVPSKLVRVGISGQLPFWIDAPATVRVRLPNAALFDNASQVGESAGVKFRLPAHVRAGVELRPNDNARVELSYEHQFWSLHDTIDITPHDVQLVGVTGFPSPYSIPPISIPRHFQDCDSVHLGGEYRIDASETTKVHVRLGFSYESSAVPKAYESPLTIAGDKFTFAGGLGVTIDRTRIDATFAYVFMPDVDVLPGDAKIPPTNPVAGNAIANTPTVNGGHYSAAAPIIGIGFQYAFDLTPPAKPHEHVTVTEPAPPPPPKKVAPPPVVAPEEPIVDEPPPPPKKKKKPVRHHTTSP